MLYCTWVILYRIENDITHYSQPRVDAGIEFRELLSRGWNIAVMGSKRRVKDFLLYIKTKENIQIEDRDRTTGGVIRACKLPLRVPLYDPSHYLNA